MSVLCGPCDFEVSEPTLSSHLARFHVGPHRFDSVDVCCGFCNFSASAENFSEILQHCSSRNHSLQAVHYNFNEFINKENRRLQAMINIDLKLVNRLAISDGAESEEEAEGFGRSDNPMISFQSSFTSPQILTPRSFPSQEDPRPRLFKRPALLRRSNAKQAKIRKPSLLRPLSISKSRNQNDGLGDKVLSPVSGVTGAVSGQGWQQLKDKDLSITPIKTNKSPQNRSSGSDGETVDESVNERQSWTPPKIEAIDEDGYTVLAPREVSFNKGTIPETIDCGICKSTLQVAKALNSVVIKHTSKHFPELRPLACANEKCDYRAPDIKKMRDHGKSRKGKKRGCDGTYRSALDTDRFKEFREKMTEIAPEFNWTNRLASGCSVLGISFL